MILRVIKWTFWITVWVLTLSFLHYTIPQIDVVRVTEIVERRVDFGENSIFWASPDSGADTERNDRYIRFVYARYPAENPEDSRGMEFRNEDTGWGWPPYFKFDSDGLQNDISDFVSDRDEPRWVAIRHYGWRNEFYTIYPNAVGMWPVDGPDDRPWNIIGWICWILAGAVLWFLTARWIKFRRNVVDATVDGIGDRVTNTKKGVTGWLDTWKSKPRR